MPVAIENYEAFRNELSISRENVALEVFRQNKNWISIKKESTAVKNLTRIIESTLKLANSKGFHSMSLRDLCSSSGISMGGLYAYIRHKDDLIRLIQSHGFIITRRTLLHYTENVTNVHDKLFAAIKAHLYLSEQMRAWFYFSYMEAKSLPEEEKRAAIAVELEVEEIFLSILEEGVNTGVYQLRSTRLVASMTKALLQDWYLKRRKYRDQNVTVDTYAVFIRDVIESYLLGK